MNFPKKPKLKILKERKKKKARAKRKKIQAKKKKELAKKLKKQAKKKKRQLFQQLFQRKDGRLNRTKDYTATIYYLIMAIVGLVMLMVFLGII